MRQVECLRRDPLGPRRAAPHGAPLLQARRRRLQWNRHAKAPRPRRGDDHLRRLREGTRHRVPRGDDPAPRLPRRFRRVLPQQAAVPPEGHPAPPDGHGHRHVVLLGHGAGPDRRDPFVEARGPPRRLRGGVGHHEVQGRPQGGAPQDRPDRAEPPPRGGRPPRDEAPDRLPPAAGRQGAEVQGAPRRAPRARHLRLQAESPRLRPRARAERDEPAGDRIGDQRRDGRRRRGRAQPAGAARAGARA